MLVALGVFHLRGGRVQARAEVIGGRGPHGSLRRSRWVAVLRELLPRHPADQATGHLVQEGLDIIFPALEALELQLRRWRPVVARGVT